MTVERGIVFVVPDDLGNPARPSGGNEYDRRLIAGLREHGWAVDVRPVAGPGDVGRAIGDLADGSVAVLDGLLLVPAAGALAAHAARLRLVVLMHMSMAVPPPGHDRLGAAAAERSVLGVAAAVIATSDWLRREIVTRHGVDPQRISAAPPGVQQAAAALPSAAGDRLLCVAAVAPHKGHDVLIDALAELADLSWTCTCVGSLDRDTEFAAMVRATAAKHDLADRIVFAGVRSRPELADDYAASDLLVLPSRSESYGMVLTEALARGLPVVASDVGGVVEAATGMPLRIGAGAAFPGALVPPDAPDALAARLREWLTDAGVRAGWRQRAAERRLRAQSWDATARSVARAIDRASAVRAP